MSITPKPFKASDNLIKTVFRGAPNIFADVDLNRQLDLQSSLDDFIISNVGGRWLGTSDNPLNLTYDYSVTGTLSWFYAVTNAVYLHKGSELKISGTTGGTNLVPFGTTRFYLVGRRDLLNFGTAPVLCGIQTDVFPNPVAGADVVRWADYGLYAANEVALPGVPPGYEIIACVAIITPATELSDNGYDLLTVPKLFYDSSPRGVVSQFSGEYPNEQAPVPSLWQAMSALTRYFRRQGQELRAALNTLTLTITSRLDAALLTLGNLVARQTHDRAFYNKFSDINQTPLDFPQGVSQSLDNIVASHTVPPGPRRIYAVHFTLAYKRITTAAELYIVVYLGSGFSTGLVSYGRLFPFTCLGGDGASSIATVSLMMPALSPGQKIVISVENQPGNGNQVRVTQAALSVDGLPE